MADIAQAYVQVIPTTQGVKGQLEKVMSSEADSAGKKSGESFAKSFSGALNSAGDKMSSIGKKMTIGIGAGIAGTAAASVAAWQEVDEAMDTITIKTGASGDALQDMQDRATKIATTIPVSFQNAGDAIGEVNTRFGLTGDALQNLSTQFIEFSNLNGTDVSSSIDSVQSAMAAFGVSSKDAGNMLDVLNKAGQDTGINVVQLASEMTANAGTLKTFGYSASDAAMLLANLSKNGVDTQAAMAGLKKVYAESVEQGKPMSTILSDLTAKLQNSKTATAAAQEAADLFGTRAAASLVPALQDGRLSFDALGTSINSFSGNVSSTYQETLDPLDQMTVNMNLLKQAGSDLVNTAAPLLTTAMTSLTQLLQEGQPVWQAAMDSLSEGGSNLCTVVGPMLQSTFQTIGEIVTTLVNAWNGLSDSQQLMVAKLAGIGLAAGPVLMIGGKAVSTIGSVVSAGSGLIGGITGLVGKLGGIASGAGSAVQSVSKIGTAASSAAAPVSSAGQSMGTLSQNALGLVAAGAGILLASAGIALLAHSAIELAGAGPSAAAAMIGLTAAVAGMAVGAAALAPALTAGAAGLVAFGAGVALIGAGILAATSGVALMASQLPNIAKYGNSAATALVKIGAAMVAASGGALTLAAGFTAMLIPVAGAAGTIALADAAILALAATFTASAAGAGLLAASMAVVASSVKTINSNAKSAGSAINEMVADVDVIGTAVDGLKDKLGDIGEAIASAFTKEGPTVSAAAGTMTAGIMDKVNAGITAGTVKMNALWTSGLMKMQSVTLLQMTAMSAALKLQLDAAADLFKDAEICDRWTENMTHLLKVTVSSMMLVTTSIRSSLRGIEKQFAATKLEFSKDIDLPHFSMSGTFNAKTGQVPSVGVDWYKKAYDNAYMLQGATIFGAMNGNLLGGGEGNGSELVVGTEKLLDLIRQANLETQAVLPEALRQAMADGRGNGINTVVLNVNGKELAEATLDDYTSVIQRRGISSNVVFGS
jgi:phage-related minor tail protein